MLTAQDMLLGGQQKSNRTQVGTFREALGGRGFLPLRRSLIGGQLKGAIDSNYKIGWSRLSEPSPAFALEKVSISAGQYITVGGTFARGKREKPIWTTGDDYTRRLVNMGEQFIVL